MLASEHHSIYKFLSPRKSQVSVRIARRSDLELIQDMHGRLSRESIYYRYLSANKPTIEDLEKLFTSRRKTALVLVATVAEPGEKVIGMAYYVLDALDPSTAEPAILVEDAYQGCGVGKQLISTLYQSAIDKGIKFFQTFIHPGNLRVQQMIKGSGFEFENKYCDGVKEIRVWLTAQV